jgi:hypothetical protein
MSHAWLVVGAVMDDETVMKFAQADLNQSVKWGLYRLGLHDDKGFIKLLVVRFSFQPEDLSSKALTKLLTATAI